MAVYVLPPARRHRHRVRTRPRRALDLGGADLLSGAARPGLAPPGFASSVARQLALAGALIAAYFLLPWHEVWTSFAQADKSWIAIALCICLLGAPLAATQWWLFLPRVHVFGLAVVHYDALAVPPVPFAEEDVARLTSPPPLGPKSNSRQALAGPETSEGMATLATALRGVVPRDRDVGVLYLCGPGVSEGG